MRVRLKSQMFFFITPLIEELLKRIVMSIEFDLLFLVSLQCAESPFKQSLIHKYTAKFHSFYQLVKTKIAPPPSLCPGPVKKPGFENENVRLNLFQTGEQVTHAQLKDKNLGINTEGIIEGWGTRVLD